VIPLSHRGQRTNGKTLSRQEIQNGGKEERDEGEEHD